MNNGFIKLHRQLSEWEWFKDSKTLHLFIYILLKANWEETSWQGHKLPKGSFITSIRHLAEDTGLSEQNIRTCLKRLKSTHEITYASTSKFTQIYVIKWAYYQCLDELTNTQTNTRSNKQLTNNQQQIKNNKKNKNKRNIYIDTLPVYDDTNNPIVDDDRLSELLEARNEI